MLICNIGIRFRPDLLPKFGLTRELVGAMADVGLLPSIFPFPDVLG